VIGRVSFRQIAVIAALSAVMVARDARADDTPTAPPSPSPAAQPSPLPTAQPSPPPAASPWSFLARITIDLPFFTRHYPNDSDFNDHNWGAFVEVALAHRIALVGGDFINSYRRNTAVAGASWLPLQLDTWKLRIRAGILLGLDLNGGYAGITHVDPLLGAFSLHIDGHGISGRGLCVLDHLGLSIMALPPRPDGGAAAVNVALAIRL
jgi:hypothetical protein